MKRTFFFWDVETNGLPPGYKLDPTILPAWPHITELSFKVVDDEKKVLESYQQYIKPEGWTVPKEPFFLARGYTTEMLMEKGVPISEAMKAFVVARKSHPYSIAHNASFDRMMCRAELMRLGSDIDFKAKRICTMMASTEFCKIPSEKKAGYKWPKLEELYRTLFNLEIKDAHTAGGDVDTLIECFFGLVEKGVIDLDKIDATPDKPKKA